MEMEVCTPPNVCIHHSHHTHISLHPQRLLSTSLPRGDHHASPLVVQLSLSSYPPLHQRGSSYVINLSLSLSLCVCVCVLISAGRCDGFSSLAVSPMDALRRHTSPLAVTCSLSLPLLPPSIPSSLPHSLFKTRSLFSFMFLLLWF